MPKGRLIPLIIALGLVLPVLVALPGNGEADGFPSALSSLHPSTSPPIRASDTLTTRPTVNRRAHGKKPPKRGLFTLSLQLPIHLPAARLLGTLCRASARADAHWVGAGRPSAAGPTRRLPSARPPVNRRNPGRRRPTIGQRPSRTIQSAQPLI